MSKVEVKETKAVEKTAEKKVLSDAVLAIAKTIKEGIAVDKVAGVGTEEAHGAIYKKAIPEGLDVETIKSVHEYDSNFVAAGAYVAGELFVEAMVGNKKLDECTCTLGMLGRDSASYTVQRRKESKNPFDPKGGTVVKMGAIGVTVEMKAGKNSGQLKLARSLIGELAMSKLKG